VVALFEECLQAVCLSDGVGGMMEDKTHVSFFFHVGYCLGKLLRDDVGRWWAEERRVVCEELCETVQVDKVDAAVITFLERVFLAEGDGVVWWTDGEGDGSEVCLDKRLDSWVWFWWW
jgi:hypothetical protein